MAKVVTVLHETPFVQLRQVDHPEQDVANYTYLHESRCNGVIVAVLPYRWVPAKVPFGARDWGGTTMEFLIRQEFCPPWSTEELICTCITGGVDEGEDEVVAAVRELEEEAGYKATPEIMRSLGNVYASKGTDTRYALFTVDVTHLTHTTPLGDGGKEEAKSYNEWVSNTDLLRRSEDALLYALAMRHGGGK